MIWRGNISIHYENRDVESSPYERADFGDRKAVFLESAFLESALLRETKQGNVYFHQSLDLPNLLAEFHVYL